MKAIVKISSSLLLTAMLLAACGNEESGANFFKENENNWPELDVIKDEIGSDFESVDVENANGNSRVILYKNDGKLQYKSLYILDEKRLKIISVEEHGEEQLYNEVIS
ncbi:hypothetical protein [Terribacillus saccharophilus]|uniref:Uncharacterized protein n=1 Tax=Terribacillus saccharophilus TaxID=361277 RepID=A0A268AA89_9BACI|nr:hypothetical protein [Terribacillus saccharophilus]PAD21037.1 hypothetical protein CHH64_10830 [Terribacillus saccharophilus]